MSYQAIARKYRPEVFADVVGQTHVTGTLRAALRKDKLSHAYLFSGPRGCGKTTVARLLAKAINCQTNREGDPCGTCETCSAIAKGNYLDVLEIDAASNTGVDNIRELRDMAQYAPSEGSSRVFIIDEVHMLSKGAFNALLKILEEPPARVFFFFATTEPNKIPRTILSRCQRFDFRLLNRKELGARLVKIAEAEEVKLEESGERLLVSLAEGSVRDGLSLLDQVIAGCDGVITDETVVNAFGLVRSELFLQLNESVIARDPAAALHLVDELATTGQSLDAFARGVVTNFRNLLLLKIDVKLAPMVDLPPEMVERLLSQAESFSEQDLLALIDRSGVHFERIHRSTQPRILLEASVVEYCRFESRVLLSELARRLGALGGGPALKTSSGPSGSQKASAPAKRKITREGQNQNTGQASATAAPSAKVAPNSPSASKPAAPAATVAASSSEKPDMEAADRLVPGWKRLIGDMMKKYPRLGACLMNGLPNLNEAGKLTVFFAEDKKFAVSSISAECGKIAEVASEQWGKKISVELVLGEQGQKEEMKEEIRQEVAPTHREELAKACADDAALGDLVDLMGGGKPLLDKEDGR